MVYPNNIRLGLEDLTSLLHSIDIQSERTGGALNDIWWVVSSTWNGFSVVGSGQFRPTSQQL